MFANCTSLFYLYRVCVCVFVRGTNKYRIALYRFVTLCIASYLIGSDRIGSFGIVLRIFVELKKNTCTVQTEGSAEKSSPYKTVTPVRCSVTFSAGGNKGGGSCHGNGKVQSLTTSLECMMTCGVTYGAGASDC